MASPEPMDISDTERKISMQACNVLNELRKNGQLCDAVVMLEDGNFSVHRAIMSACSPYFRALFTNGMNETDQREIFIPGVTTDMMGLIVDYAYTREVTICSTNVERLLQAADQFHVLGLVKACTNFLATQLEPENCIGIRSFARLFFCSNLERLATHYIMENFLEISVKSNEILNLTQADLVEILESDDLNVKNEETVFDCMVRWIKHDEIARKPQTFGILKTIRLGLLSTEYFVETVKNHPYIKESEECRPLVIDTLKFLYDLDMEDKEVDITHPLARPRVPHEVMFVVGGWSSGSPTNAIETYDTRADRWILIEHPDRGPRAYHGCATVGKKVYIIGGFDGMDYFNSCRCLDTVEKKWCEVSPMNARRCYVSVAVLAGCIYAMGGYDGQLRQNTAERYTPKHNQWSLISPMNHQRSDASGTTCDGKVYICGGFNGQECLNTAEYYDPQTNQWTLVAPMRNRRSGVSVICHGAQVYAIGGFNGVTRMNNGERYSPTTNTWTNISEMYSPRSNFGIEVIDDMIFAIGGFNGVNTIANVECYDPSVEEWYDCTDMNINRSALSACVVKGLPNVRDYIHKDRSKIDDKKKRSNAAVAAATAANPRIAAANAIVQAAARNAAAQTAANNVQIIAGQNDLQNNNRQHHPGQNAQQNLPRPNIPPTPPINAGPNIPPASPINAGPNIPPAPPVNARRNIPRAPPNIAGGQNMDQAEEDNGNNPFERETDDNNLDNQNNVDPLNTRNAPEENQADEEDEDDQPGMAAVHYNDLPHVPQHIFPNAGPHQPFMGPFVLGHQRGREEEEEEGLDGEQHHHHVVQNRAMNTDNSNPPQQ